MNSRGPAAADAGGFVRFTGVKKSYDSKSLVVNRFDLDVARGEFITLLGPSGSGKTTILMMLAGFESVTGGDIRIGGISVTRTPPYKRNIGMVFQNYALFPHMTVGENLAYPLSVRNRRRDGIAARVGEYLDLVGLGGFRDRYPAQLSGGQRQRVALARALIFEPSLVLMDEPLGALDRKLREQMQLEISRLHRKLGFTVIYVTHDQTEALTMSDRVAIFNEGVVQQCAAPDTLYERPANAFVAGFIGENNFVSGTVAAIGDGSVRVTLDCGEEIVANRAEVGAPGDRCTISVRPEKISVESAGDPAGRASANRVSATFMTRQYVGDFVRCFFRLSDDTGIAVKLLNQTDMQRFGEGDRVRLVWQPSDCHAFRA